MCPVEFPTILRVGRAVGTVRGTMLNDNAEEQFAREFIATLCATEAYRRIRPDVTDHTAADQGSKWIRKPHIAARIGELRRDRERRTNVDGDYLLRKCVSTINADPNELVEIRRDCCRYCYGEGHRYQYTPAEWEAVWHRYLTDWDDAMAGNRKQLPREPDPRGGIGFNRRLPPLPNCPECHGEGVLDTFVKDSRLLSPEARELYAGVRVTRHGIEVKKNDRDKNIEMAGRMLGAFKDRVDHTNAGGRFEPMSLGEFYGKQSDSGSDEPES